LLALFEGYCFLNKKQIPLAKTNHVQQPKFSVEFLEDAAQFIDGLDEKVKEKIIYNITTARFSNDSELFKKLTQEIWEFRT